MRILKIIFILIFFSGIALAGSVEFDVNPKIIKLGEVGNISIVVHDIKSPQEPHLTHDNFTIQSTGSVSQTSFFNGKRSRSQTFSFRFAPSKTGEYTIGPFDYEVKRGQIVKLPPIKIQVVAPNNTQKKDTDISEFIFAELTSTKDVVYENENIELIMSIYFREITLGNQIQLVNFQTEGLSLGEFSEANEGREMVGNKLFNVKRFRVKAQVTKSGKITGAPILSVPIVTRNRSNRFDPFFNDAFRTTSRLEIVVKPLEMDSHKIPLKGRPNGYAGAVGKFEMNISLTPTELKAGEPINVKIDIRGRGNINIVTAPDIKYGDKFKYYEANLVENNKDNGSFGRKVFEQVAIPKSEQVTEFPKIEFSYFDTEEGIYKTISQGPFPLTVVKGESVKINTSLNIVQEPIEDKPEPEIGGEDIIYLKAVPVYWGKRGFNVFSTKMILIGYCIPIFVLILFILWIIKNRYLYQDKVVQRRRYAFKKVSHNFKKLQPTNNDNYYDVIFKSIHSYFTDYYNLSQGESIPFEKLETSICNEIKLILDKCELVRFAGSKDVVEDADKWLEHILKILKKHDKLNGRRG